MWGHFRAMTAQVGPPDEIREKKMLSLSLALPRINTDQRNQHQLSEAGDQQHLHLLNRAEKTYRSKFY